MIDYQPQTIRCNQFILAPYLKRSNKIAIWQILSTLIPVACLWCLVAKIDQTSLSLGFKVFALIPVLLVLALFSSRAFSLMHDCGHGSLFCSRWLNRTIGFSLGVLNAIPQFPWSRDHAFHHRHNGNWEKYRGPIDVLTLEDYQSLTKLNKLGYVASRHWLMLFPGGFYYLIIKPRIALAQALYDFILSIGAEIVDAFRKKEFARIFLFSTRFRVNHSGYGNTFWEIFDLIANNILVIISWTLMSHWLGTGLFLSCYSVVMTISAAIFICIFFVQHNFKDSYASRTDGWSSIQGALEGTSNLDLPRWLNWFFADISFHSIHHLSDKIPNYKLRLCHLRNQHLLSNAKTIRIEEVFQCFKYILWDMKSEKLTVVPIE